MRITPRTKRLRGDGFVAVRDEHDPQWWVIRTSVPHHRSYQVSNGRVHSSHIAEELGALSALYVHTRTLAEEMAA